MDNRQRKYPRHDYSEDIFAETRMAFGEHLEELRGCLIKALVGIVIGLIAGFPAAIYLFDEVKAPVEAVLKEYHIDYLERKPERANELVDELHARVMEAKEGSPLAELNKPRAVMVGVSRAALRRLLQADQPEKATAQEPDAAAEPDAFMPIFIKSVDFVRQAGPAFTLAAKRYTLTSLGPLEAFMMYFLLSLLVGLVLSSPWVFYQLWKFVGAGLYPHEKKYVHLYLPFSLFLFLGGIAICQFLVIPAALKGLLLFNRWMDIEPDFRLSYYLSFAILMPLVFGISFQTPMVMLFLEKLGIFSVNDFRSKRRIAYFVIFVIAAVITPSQDPQSMLWLAVPVVALYELGIVLVTRSERRRREEFGEEEVAYDPALHGSATDGVQSEEGTPGPAP